MEDIDSLRQSIEVYKEQLNKVNQTIAATSSGPEKNELIGLRDNIEELLNLTQESLHSLVDNDKSKNEESSAIVAAADDEDPFAKEYALFKAELGDIDDKNECKNDENEKEENLSGEEETPSIFEDLEKIIGMKCQAPYTSKSGSTGYHNALVSGIETNDSISDLDHIKVRVLFTYPTERDMVTCPYFLDDRCNFGEEKCNFSHGYFVPFGELREYREPDFTNLKRGSRVLAKIGDNKVWKSTVIEEISSDEQVLVKHEGNFAAVPIHDIFPLTNDDGDSSDLTTDDEMDEDLLRKNFNSRQEEMVELSLSRQPQTQRMGDWEKFTKGIGSKLMAKMGYVVGCGLGKNGEGRLDPVEALVLPAGKSLDHCMNLKEAAGGSKDLFSAEKVQKKLALREIRRTQKAYRRQKHREKHNVFNFINRELNAAAEPGTSSKTKSNQSITNKISKTSCRELNVERFKIAEDIRESEKRIYILSESLTRQKPDSVPYNNIMSKLQNERGKLHSLKSFDGKVEREQTLRETKRKMTIF
ncbi:unnamed protein product [Nezara viridula]|uniref:Zinc finger CCCH-type with G patch domain-containing protein n=1 Tax=Nezara viridula TaxID=85310 RepID=A0A9P0HG53_NEZVI|nr:unnamed protein product [Nezara viridula]